MPRRAKGTYHHGDLRQALIDAARRLIVSRGEQNFSLAEACRIAGVSTAAPYRHFRNKDEILGNVVAQGFDAMTERMELAASRHPAGSVKRIVAIERLYIAFAFEERALFRLMFGQKPSLARDETFASHGKACFAFVIDEVAAYCAANKVEEDPQMVAVQLWTLVHGAASLLVDDDYAKVAPDLDSDRAFFAATAKLLRRGGGGGGGEGGGGGGGGEGGLPLEHPLVAACVIP